MKYRNKTNACGKAALWQPAAGGVSGALWNAGRFFYETCNYIRGKDNQISLFRHSDDIFIYPFSVIRSRSVSVSLEKLYTQAKIMTGGIAASMPV